MPLQLAASGASAAFWGAVISAQDGPDVASADFAGCGVGFALPTVVLAGDVGMTGVAVWAKTWLEKAKASAAPKINGAASGLQSNIAPRPELTVYLEVLQKAGV